MKTLCVNKSKLIKSTIIILPIIACFSANAAGTTVIDYVQIVIDACVQMGANIGEMIIGSWPTIVSVTLAFLGIPVFKKLAHKIAG